VLKWHKNNEKCDIACVTSLNEAMLCTVHTNAAKIRASYGSAATLGVS
jgi:hypothetical protein